MRKSVFLIVFLLIPGVIFAAKTPTTGSKFYEIYDIMVNDLVKGPPGISVSIGGVAYGGLQLFTNRILPAIGALFGAVLLLASPAIATGLGALVP